MTRPDTPPVDKSLVADVFLKMLAEAIAQKEMEIARPPSGPNPAASPAPLPDERTAGEMSEDKVQRRVYLRLRSIRGFGRLASRTLDAIAWNCATIITSEKEAYAAQRVAEERDRLTKQLEEAKAYGSDRHAKWRASEDVIYTMTYPEADADLLDAIAEEISCGGNESLCEDCSIEWDTNASSCRRDDDPADKIGCRWTAKDQIQALARALRARPPSEPAPVKAGVRHGIYIASRASVPERAAAWRTLRSDGWPVTCTWIDEDGPGQTKSMTELWSRIEREVTSSAALMLYVEPDDFPLKGALIEVGMALAAGIPVFVVAPGVQLDPTSKRPIGSWMFHPLVRHVATIGEVRALLADAPVDQEGGV